MPLWEIDCLFTVPGATPEEARAWLARHLRESLRPGEPGSAWRSAPTETPRYRIASVPMIRPEPGVHSRDGE